MELFCVIGRRKNKLSIYRFFLRTLRRVRQSSRHARRSANLSNGHISSNCFAISAAAGPVMRGTSPKVWLTYQRRREEKK